MSRRWLLSIVLLGATWFVRSRGLQPGSIGRSASGDIALTETANEDAYDNRTIYHELNSEIIGGIPDEWLELAVLDFMASKTDDSAPLRDRGLAGWSGGFRAVYATIAMEYDVVDGGFETFFVYSGLVAYDARDGCLLLGAPELAKLMDAAIELEKQKGTPDSSFPETGAPALYDTHHRYADFADLNDRFIWSKENLSRLRISYIRDHAEEFTGTTLITR